MGLLFNVLQKLIGFTRVKRQYLTEFSTEYNFCVNIILVFSVKYKTVNIFLKLDFEKTDRNWIIRFVSRRQITWTLINWWEFPVIYKKIAVFSELDANESEINRLEEPVVGTLRVCHRVSNANQRIRTINVRRLKCWLTSKPDLFSIYLFTFS